MKLYSMFLRDGKYRFPNTTLLREVWRQACRMQKASQSMVACEKHFVDNDFVINSKGQRRLKKGRKIFCFKYSIEI